MRLSLKTLSAALICLLIPNLTTAEQRQFGETIYQVDPNWLGGNEKDNRKVLLGDFDDDRCAFCRIYIARAVPFDGALTEFVTLQITRFIDPEDHGDVEIIQSATPYELAGKDAAVIAIKRGRYYQILYAVELGGRAVMLGFQGDSRTKADYEVFKTSVRPFLDQLRFAADAGEDLLPDAIPGDMSGIWWSHATVTGMQLDGTMTTRVDHKTLVFFPDGHVHFATPPGGITVLDRDASRTAGDTAFGVYTMPSRNRIEIMRADGKRYELSRDGDSWKMEGTRRTYSQVTPVPDSMSLEGQVSSFNASSFAQGSGISGGVISGSNTRFFSDGTYEGRSFGSVSASTSAGGLTTSSGEDNAGRYEIRDGLLIMTPTDGPSRSQLIFNLGDGILIGDKVLSE